MSTVESWTSKAQGWVFSTEGAMPAAPIRVFASVRLKAGAIRVLVVARSRALIAGSFVVARFYRC
jgi:hypothetical protein